MNLITECCRRLCNTFVSMKIITEFISKERLFVIACLLGIAVSLFAQEQVSIAPFYGNRKAALTLTFDDGLQEHYTHVFPELKKRNMHATFAVIASKVGGVMRSKQDRQNGTRWLPMVRRLPATDGSTRL